MSLFITSLNSGSNGNCYYVGNEHEAILVDVGISCREVEKRLKNLGLAISKIKAIFISHEHTDHISGIPTLAKKYSIPVYITPGTLQHLRINYSEYRFINFIAGKPVIIGDLAVTAFTKAHDATDPHSFIVTCRDITVGVFTDLGVACQNLVSHFSKCHAAFLEANYDDEMLDNGGYPYFLKQRIRGGNGHLSNKQALDLFINHRPAFMSHLLLAHLSKNNNDPQLVDQLFNTHADGVEIIVAPRYQETPVYFIGGERVVRGMAKQLAFEL